MIYKAYRYDLKGKKMLKTTEKYYAADTGIRNVIMRGAEDVGRVLENVVFLELMRGGIQSHQAATMTKRLILQLQRKEVR